MSTPVSLDITFQGLPFNKSKTSLAANLNTLDIVSQGLVYNSFDTTIASFVVCNISSEEVINATDVDFYTISQLPVETLDATDTDTSVSDGQDHSPATLAEQVFFTYYLTFVETLNGDDTSSNGVIQPTPYNFDYSFSTMIQVGVSINDYYSTKLGVQIFDDLLATTQISVIDNTFPAVTNLTSISNQFTPTVIINGVTLVSNIGTAPTNSTANTPLYINIAGAGISNTLATPCDLQAYSFTLDQTGGTWNVSSVVKFGPLAATVLFFGLLAAITNEGKILSNGQTGYTYSGIFGSLLLHRRFEYLVSSNATVALLLSNPAFNSPDPNDWLPTSSIAAAIGAAGGISVNWTIPNSLISDFSIDKSSNAISVLSSLAERNGGILRWKGGTSYDVVFPNIAYGAFTLPSCKLLLPDGIKEECFYDLETANFIVPIIISDPSITDSGVQEVPTQTEQPKDSQKQYQQLAKMSKKLTVDDPPSVYDLPYDYDQVFIQILVNDKGQTGGNNIVSIHNFITRDPHQVFEYDVGTFGTEYLFVTNIGGVLQPQVMVDYRIFPVEGTNSTIDTNNFILTLACTRKSIQGLLESDKVADEARQEAVLKNTQDRFRFIKQCQWTLSFIFFGVLPMPGMKFNYTASGIMIFRPSSPTTTETIVIDNIVVDGIIETVSFNFPGYVTITVVKYKKIRFHESARIQYISAET